MECGGAVQGRGACARDVESVHGSVFRGFDGDEEATLAQLECAPGASIGRERACGNEQVHMGMPLEGARPGV
jgi:hypothetical protein